MRKLVILGATGSIGEQALEVVASSEDLSVVGLAAGRGWERLVAQARPSTPALDAHIEATWRTAVERAARDGHELFDGDVLRWIVERVRERGGRRELEMTVAPAKYREFVGTNLDPTLRASFDGETQGPAPAAAAVAATVHPWARFANAIGTSAVVAGAALMFDSFTDACAKCGDSLETGVTHFPRDAYDELLANLSSGKPLEMLNLFRLPKVEKDVGATSALEITACPRCRRDVSAATRRTANRLRAPAAADPGGPDRRGIRGRALDHLRPAMDHGTFRQGRGVRAASDRGGLGARAQRPLLVATQ
jgi:hypothetical protein